jgi:hypothetical protein
MRSQAIQSCVHAIQAAIAAVLAIVVLMPSASAASITTVAVWANFSDSTGAFSTSGFQTLSVGAVHPLSVGGTIVPFDIERTGTTTVGSGYTASIITISYDLTGTPFIDNPAYMSFEWARNQDHDYIPAAAVIDYTKWSPTTPGYYLFGPSGYVDFQSFVQNNPAILPDGAPQTGFFSIAYVNPTPVPAALPLLVTGLGVLGFAGWHQSRRPSAGTPSPF